MEGTYYPPEEFFAFNMAGFPRVLLSMAQAFYREAARRRLHGRRGHIG